MGGPDRSDRRRTLTVAEAAELLGISKSAAYDFVRSGELPAIRLGRRVLIPESALLRLLGEDAA